MTNPAQPAKSIAELVEENQTLKAQYEDALAEIELLKSGVETMHDVGIYYYRHPLENAVAYQDALESIKAQIRTYIADGRAIEASTRFTFDNSLAKGRKMTAELAKLMLRAYNAEAENCVRYVKAGNLPSAEKRLTGAATSIARYAQESWTSTRGARSSAPVTEPTSIGSGLFGVQLTASGSPSLSSSVLMTAAAPLKCRADTWVTSASPVYRMLTALDTGSISDSISSVRR